MSVAPTLATRRLARTIVAQTPILGADAALKNLPKLAPDQYPALVALLAKYAAARTGLPIVEERLTLDRMPPGAPLVFTPTQRRDAHRRYANGERRPEVVAAEREYQRVKAREKRTRQRLVAESIERETA